MSQITLFGVTLDDAAEGPFSLSVWPPSDLDRVLRGYRKRTMQELNSHNTRPDGTPRPTNHRREVVKQKKRGIVQFHDGIDQRGNGGRR